MSQKKNVRSIKRLRIFAGPNGSGKSTLLYKLQQRYDLGVVVNADVISAQLKTSGELDFDSFSLSTNPSEFSRFCQSPDNDSFIRKIGKPAFVIENNRCLVPQNQSCDLGYNAALIAGFIRYLLCRTGLSFSYETVLSHRSKIVEIQDARERGYRIYLYFVCLDSSDVSVRRVHARVQMGGHDVETGKIKDRYTRSLENLLPVLQLSHRAYLFDNSKQMEMVSEFEEPRLKLLRDEDRMPNWFSRYIRDRLEND